MNTEIKKKLVALEANVDAVLFRRMYEDEEQQSGMGVGRALNIGVGAAALGAGAYGAKIGDQAIRRKYGMMPGVGRREAYRRAGMDAMDAAKGYGSRAQDAVTGSEGFKAGQKAWQRSAGQGTGLFSRVRRVLGGATRAMTGGRFGFEAIEGRVNRLIELAEVRINEKGQRSDQNLRRGAMGLLTGSIGSGAGSLVNAGRFNEENEIYRKRDAAGHSLVGGLAGVPVGLAGGAVAARMRSPGAMAATAIGGTLGAIGVGYGVSRAMGERSLDKRKRDSLLARLQAGQQG
jgi:hypothetical protein